MCLRYDDSHHIFSCLKTLLDPFNETVDRFIDRLQPLADGKTPISMSIKFNEFTLEVISKVIKHKAIDMYSYSAACMSLFFHTIPADALILVLRSQLDCYSPPT